MRNKSKKHKISVCKNFNFVENKNLLIILYNCV